jgi:hypothetical protein
VPSVLLATCAALPDGDEDGALLLDALARAGVDAAWAAWTDDSIDWNSALVVLRSTWDYTTEIDAFLDWVRGLERVANAAPVIEWNTDKLYLRDLDVAGVPIVPTAFVTPGEDLQLAGYGEFVVKPSIGAGSRGAGRFTADRTAAARVHAAELHDAGRVVLVQPYLDAVDAAGETSLIYLDGRFSHAIRKGPMLGSSAAYGLDETLGLYLEENISPRDPDPAEVGVGDAAVAFLRERFDGTPLYTRVDLLPSTDGPVVIELELTEPSLFLQDGQPDAATSPADLFAAAIAARA